MRLYSVDFTDDLGWSRHANIKADCFTWSVRDNAVFYVVDEDTGVRTTVWELKTRIENLSYKEIDI